MLYNAVCSVLLSVDQRPLAKVGSWLFLFLCSYQVGFSQKILHILTGFLLL